MRVNIPLIVFMLIMAAVLVGCSDRPAAGVDDVADAVPTPVFEPISLVRDPAALSVAPLPRPEAERVFRWPEGRKPSLLFIYDDEAT